MRTSESILKISAAILAARRTFPKIDQDKVAKGKAFSYKYASLPHILQLCEAKLWDQDVLVIQALSRSEKANHISVETMAVHAPSGEFMAEVFEMPLDTGGAQGTGITASYARRYAFNAFFMIAPDDDTDGKGLKEPRTDTKSHSPAMIAWCALAEERRQELSKLVGPIVDYLNEDLPLEAIGYLERKVPSQEEQVALWSQFDSVQRRAMKDADAKRKQPKGTH